MAADAVVHFDHGGGTTRIEGGAATLSFPRATFHLQRRNWKWAHQPSDKDRGSFREETFELLEKSGRLHLLDVVGWIELASTRARNRSLLRHQEPA